MKIMRCACLVLWPAAAVAGTIEGSSALSVSDGSGADLTPCGATPVTFTVTLTPASGQVVQVAYATVSGTAASPGDYTQTTGVLTFPPGTTVLQVPVPVVDDLMPETTETFTLGLANPVNAILTDPVGVGTITDQDGKEGNFRGEVSHGRVVMEDLRGSDLFHDHFHLFQWPAASYEAVADGVSGDVGPLMLQRVDCQGNVVQNGVPTGAGSSRALRWEHLSASLTASEHILVRSGGCTTNCGADDVYRLRFYDTTGAIARVNNSGTQVSVLALQNVTTSPVQGHVRFWRAAGTLALEEAFSLPARGTLTLNTAGLPALAGFSGSATVSHDGPYGALAGKAVALEPSSGFSFDTPLSYRPR